MGGSMASIIASMPIQFPGLRFVITAGAPDIEMIARALCISPEIPADIRSLHIGGTKDKAVPIESSIKLSNRFFQSEFLTHDQAHCVPTKAIFLDKYVDFVSSIHAEAEAKADHTISKDHNEIVNCSNDLNSTLPSSTKSIEPESCICCSDDHAIAQKDEIDALLAIFPDELQVIAPPPEKGGDLCAIFILKCPKSFASLNSSIDRLIDQLSLKFRLPGDYPLSSTAMIELQTGSLSLLEFTSSMRSSLMSRIVRNNAVF
jgi:hypothetical protein